MNCCTALSLRLFALVSGLPHIFSYLINVTMPCIFSDDVRQATGEIINLIENRFDNDIP